MQTITKKDLIDRIAESTDQRRVVVKKTVQEFLNAVIDELGKGNRLEFRDFGVFETKIRRPRQAQNPKTLQPVPVPAKRTVKFKPGRLMKRRLEETIDQEAMTKAGLSTSDEGTPEIVTRKLTPVETTDHYQK
jgi:integration host factor subunit beta